MAMVVSGKDLSVELKDKMKKGRGRGSIWK